MEPFLQHFGLGEDGISDPPGIKLRYFLFLFIYINIYLCVCVCVFYIV